MTRREWMEIAVVTGLLGLVGVGTRFGLASAPDESSGAPPGETPPSSTPPAQRVSPRPAESPSAGTTRPTGRSNPSQTPTSKASETQDDVKYRAYKKFLQQGGCGSSRYVWRDAGGKIVHEGPWNTPGFACGMGRFTEKSVSFVNEIQRQRAQVTDPTDRA